MTDRTDVGQVLLQKFENEMNSVDSTTELGNPWLTCRVLLLD